MLLQAICVPDYPVSVWMNKIGHKSSYFCLVLNTMKWNVPNSWTILHYFDFISHWKIIAKISIKLLFLQKTSQKELLPVSYGYPFPLRVGGSFLYCTIPTTTMYTPGHLHMQKSKFTSCPPGQSAVGLQIVNTTTALAHSRLATTNELHLQCKDHSWSGV